MYLQTKMYVHTRAHSHIHLAHLHNHKAIQVYYDDFLSLAYGQRAGTFEFTEIDFVLTKLNYL